MDKKVPIRYRNTVLSKSKNFGMVLIPYFSRWMLLLDILRKPLSKRIRTNLIRPRASNPDWSLIPKELASSLHVTVDIPVTLYYLVKYCHITPQTYRMDHYLS